MITPETLGAAAEEAKTGSVPYVGNLLEQAANAIATRDCVVMPRELDDEMRQVLESGEIHYDSGRYGNPDTFAALIAEIDRREREAGK